MILDFLASISFYIIPYLTGRIFVKSVSQAWLLGALIWFISFFAVSFLSINSLVPFTPAIIVLALIFSLTSIFRIVKDNLGKKPSFNKSFILIGFFLTVLTLFIYFFLWKKATPYPLQLNWDIYEHITLANAIANGKIQILTTSITDTFTVNSYTALFGVLLSLPKILFGRGLLGIYWFLEYWHFFITTIVAFLLAKKVFKNNSYALTSAIFSSLVFESSVSYTSLFLIPQTLVAVLTAFIIYDIKKYKLPSLLLALVVICFLHFVIGVVASIIILIFYFYPKINLSNKVLNIGILASLIGAIAIFASNLFYNLSFSNLEESKHFAFSFFEKVNLINQWYSLFFIPLVAVGIYKIIRSEEFEKKIFLIVSLLLFSVSFAPISYFLKFYTLEHFFINIVIVEGIGVLVLGYSLIIKIFSLIFLTFIMMINLYDNLIIYKDPLHFNNYETQLSSEEINAANWLSKLPDKNNAFIISDPATQYILEALSEVNSQGGVFMSLSTRKTLQVVYGSYDPSYIRQKLFSIKDLLPKDNPQNRKTYYVVGGRYFAWQRLPGNQKDSSFYNIWSPKTMTDNDRNYVSFLKRYFKAVYESDQIVIFEIK